MLSLCIICFLYSFFNSFILSKNSDQNNSELFTQIFIRTYKWKAYFQAKCKLISKSTDIIAYLQDEFDVTPPNHGLVRFTFITNHFNALVTTFYCIKSLPTLYYFGLNKKFTFDQSQITQFVKILLEFDQIRGDRGVVVV